MAALHSPMAHYKRKQIARLGDGEKKYIYNMFCDRAGILDVLPNNLIRKKLEWGYNDDTIWQFLNICCIFDNMAYVLNDLPSVGAWFRRPKDEEPFNGQCALELLQEDYRNAAKLRFYTNQVVYQYEQEYLVKPPLVLPNSLTSTDNLN